MSNSVRPQRQQSTRLPHPWDSPGKNTGVGCHFLLQCMKVKSKSEVTQSCPTLRDPVDCSPPGSSVHGIFQAGVLEWGAIAFSGSIYLGKVNIYKPQMAGDGSTEYAFVITSMPELDPLHHLLFLTHHLLTLLRVVFLRVNQRP